MSTDPASSYDELPYSDHCFPYTHPDHLAIMGAIYGRGTPSADRCRVLELGCAAGGNLIPMALESPRSEFVGIDLSARQVAAGRATVEALGLRNIALHAVSITDVDESFGQFDYIVCHGVYSWVPAPVRERILAVCAERLVPNGVAYVSYNTYPGWHGRGMARNMMAFHVRGSAGALDRVQSARDFLDDVLRVLPEKGSAYASILATERKFLRGVGNSYFYHEHLEETNHPLYFFEFMNDARAKGLRFLAEARTPGLGDNLPQEAQEMIDRWSDDDVAREQYIDFLCNRTFRRTLLCHASEPKRPEPSSDALATLWIGTSLVPVADAPDVASSAPEEFRKRDEEGRLTTNNPLVKTALVLLHRAHPDVVPFASLWKQVQDQLSSAGAAITATDESESALRGALLRCFQSNLVELHSRRPRYASQPNERPLAAALARYQAQQGGRVTNLRRRTVELPEFDRLVLAMLDGTLDRAAILDRLSALVESDEFSIYEGDAPIRDLARVKTMIADELEPCLHRLAGFALLAADAE